MCPIVPTFTCGLLRSNFSFAITMTSTDYNLNVSPYPPDPADKPTSYGCPMFLRKRDFRAG